MACSARVGLALCLALGSVLACQSIIGADFGNYHVGDDGPTNVGGESGGGGATSGRGGGATGGSAGSETTGGGGAMPQGGASGEGSGGTAEGGTSAGGSAGDAGAGGTAGDAGAGGSAGDSGGPVRVVMVSGGRMHTCAVLEGGDLKCWGDGFYGQTGSDAAGKEGDMPNELGDLLLPVNVGGGRQVEGIATGEHHTCVLLDDGHVRCFGRNSYGQLGLGDAEERGNEDGEMAALVDVDLGTGRTATAVAAGTFQTCVILDDGTVKCWGSNSMGSLGLGWPPDAAIGHALVGDESSEIVSALPPVALGTGRPVRISVGSDSTCVVFEDGRVKCWGDNTYGELGISGPSRGASSADMGESLPALALGEDAVDVGVGAGHACALLLSGNVKCWGENTGGRLGLGTNTGELTLPTTNVDLGTGRTAVALSVGQTHACVMLDTTEMKCWGSAASGGLGLGFNTTVGDAGGEMGNALPSVDLGDDDTVFAIGTGNLHTCAVLAGARALKCWGQNEEGQLGLGDTRDRGADVDDMGNALPTIDLGTRP